MDIDSIKFFVCRNSTEVAKRRFARAGGELRKQLEAIATEQQGHR